MTQLLTDRRKDDKKGIEWPAQQSSLSKSFEIFCKTIFKFYCPLSVYGAQNLPAPPYLICSNHMSHLDSVMLMVATGFSFQRVGLIAAKDYFFDQGHRFFLHYMMNLVPITRATGPRALRESIAACRSFLESGGRALVIYPEGTRSITGEIAHFKEGCAIIAYDLDLPIVPACVIGSNITLPKGKYFIRPHKISVRFGKPFKVSDWLTGEKNDRKMVFSAYREATAELERSVRALMKEGVENHE
jgi:1-acyl-sn-glycerol-3-phosphate acyltransferase